MIDTYAFFLTQVFIKIGIIVVANSGIVWQSEFDIFFAYNKPISYKIKQY